MHEEAEETERRTLALVERLEGKKTAIQEKGRETKGEATEMMGSTSATTRTSSTASSSSRWPRRASSATGRSSAR